MSIAAMFTNDRLVRGVTTGQYDKPEWEPLLELAAEHVDDFMFVYIWPDQFDSEEPASFREVDPQRLLELVLERSQFSRCPE